MKRLNLLGKRFYGIAFGMLAGISQLSAQDATGWIPLIDRVSGLENFNRTGAADWVAADEAIQVGEGGEGFSFLVTKDAYGDFELRVEVWASDDANSGIFLRCADPAQIDPATCYEVNIFDQRPDPAYGTGAIVDVAKVDPMPSAGGRWNTFEITARGPRLTVVFNGQQTVTVEDDRLAKGPIALQWGAGLVKFRKVTIRPR